MKVLMLTGEYPPGPGGVGDYTAMLSTHLLRLGVEVAVLTSARNSPRPPGGGTGRPAVLRSVRGWGFRSWPWIEATARALGSRILHLQYQAAAYAMNPAVNLLPGYLRLRLPGVRVVTTFHDLRVPYLFPKAGPARRCAIRVLDLLSHGAVLTNQADLDDLGGVAPNGSLGPRRRWLIPLGSNIARMPPPDFDRADWRRRWGAGPDTLLVSYFGFMNDSKGMEFLIQALGMLAGRGVALRLLIVGGEAGETDPTNSGYTRRILQLIRSHQLQERVVWTGFLPPEQVSASLLSSDVCALPFRDGASTRRGSLLAALAHGLPVVTTLPDRADPLLVAGENVVMVPRDHSLALAAALESLWRDPEARSRLSAGAEALATHFNWLDIAARHREAYEEMMGRG